jgi:hypothetical protein
MSPRATVLNKKGSAGRNIEKYKQKLQNLSLFDHFLSTSDQNL